MDGWMDEWTDGPLSAPSGVSLSLCVSAQFCPFQPSPHPGFLPDRARGPQYPKMPTGLGRRVGFVAWLEWGAYRQPPASPLPLPAAPSHRGPVALVSEVFEQHLGGHILQVRPLPGLTLIAATWRPLPARSTLLTSVRPSEGASGPRFPFRLAFPRATESPAPPHPPPPINPS